MKTTLNIFLYLNLIGVGYNLGNMIHQCFEHKWLLVAFSAFALVLGTVAAIACDKARREMEALE